MKGCQGLRFLRNFSLKIREGRAVSDAVRLLGRFGGPHAVKKDFLKMLGFNSKSLRKRLAARGCRFYEETISLKVSIHYGFAAVFLRSFYCLVAQDSNGV